MSVVEVASATGEWSLTLRENTPLTILDQLDYFGHVAIMSGRVNAEEYGDNLLDAARYVGVNLSRSFGVSNKKLAGPGMAFWLGDSEDKGAILEEPIELANATFVGSITAVLPLSVQVGTITPLSGTYSGTHYLVTPRKALDYITGLYDAEWRVTGRGKLDAGAISDLYVTNPVAAVIRDKSGVELDYRALPGKATLDSDMKDFTTRILMMASGTETSEVTATADILPGLNPYLDLYGNPIQLSRVIQEDATSTGNAPARAQLQLNRFTSPRDQLKLSTRNGYRIEGTVKAGDYVWVYDPDAKLIDEANPIDFQGIEIHPMKLRVFQLSWPITSDMGVYFRTQGGEWIDLSDYFVPENSDTDLTVGGYNRSLTGVGSNVGSSPGSQPIENTTTPESPGWQLPFTQSTYQSEADGLTRAQVVLDWTQPLNTDGSVITDGHHYELRWRTGETAIYPVTHEDMSEYQHAWLDGTNASPIPFTVGAWQYTQVTWEVTQFLLLDLTPGIPYDFQVRAVDNATPANVSEWSESIVVQTRPDTTAPSTPAPPASIAGSRNAAQIVHYLGKSSGGTFNLEADLNHLQIHAGVEPTYETNAVPVELGGTLLGRLPATQGMLRGQIPVVGTVPLNDDPGVPRYYKIVAVDHFGNESGPSEPMLQTAELIDSAFISELTVSKVGAGQVTANWLMAAEMKTAENGARVVIAWYGIEVFNINSVKTFDVNSADGSVEVIGKLSTGPTGSRIVVSDEGFPTIRFWSTPTDKSAFINSFDDAGNNVGLGLNSAVSDDTQRRAITYMRPDAVRTIIAAADGHPTLPDQASLGGDLGVNRDTIMVAIRDVNGSNDIDGGYLQLGRAGGTSRFGHWSASNVESAFRFDSNGDLQLVYNGIIKTWTGPNGTDIYSRVYTPRIAGLNNGRLYIHSDDGADVFFYWGGGPPADLYIGWDNGSGGAYAKTFVIDHPDAEDQYLVHATVEGPVAGVEYSGVAVARDHHATVQLPDYFESLTKTEERVVLLTPILEDTRDLYDEESDTPRTPAWSRLCKVAASPVQNGQFEIYTDGPDGTKVNWLVKATRKDIPQFDVEPMKSEGNVHRVGPYTWLES